MEHPDCHFRESRGAKEQIQESLIYGKVHLCRVAYLLFSTCSFTPAVLPLDERRFKIVFKPLVSSAAVAEQLEGVRTSATSEPESFWSTVL